MIKRLVAIILLLFCSDAFAAEPTISNVTGTTTLTITGTNFGTKSTAAPLRFDNFESGTTGAELSSTSSGWFSDSVGPYYSTAKTRYPGTKSLLQTFAGSSYRQMIGLHNGTFPGQIPATQEIYSTYWYKFENDSTTPARNTKWFNGGSLDGWQTRTDIYPINGSGHIYSYLTSGCGASGSSAQDYAPRSDYVALDDGNWHRIETYLKMGPSGYRDLWIDGVRRGSISGAFTSESCELGYWYIGHYFSTDWNEAYQPVAGGACTLVPGGIWRGRTDRRYYTCQANKTWSIGTTTEPPRSAAKRYIDQAYVDTTPARVEICNAATKANSTHCEIQRPTAWSSTSITVAPNYGTFTTGASAYLYVINSGLEVNVTGRAITIGESYTATCDTDPSLCTTSEACLAAWPTYTFDVSLDPDCQYVPPAPEITECTFSDWFACSDLTTCNATGRIWGEDACRTQTLPNLTGTNIVNQHLEGTGTSAPTGWSGTGIVRTDYGTQLTTGSYLNWPDAFEGLQGRTVDVIINLMPGGSGVMKLAWGGGPELDYITSEAGTHVVQLTVPNTTPADDGLYLVPTGTWVVNDVIVKGHSDVTPMRVMTTGTPWRVMTTGTPMRVVQ